MESPVCVTVRAVLGGICMHLMLLSGVIGVYFIQDATTGNFTDEPFEPERN